MEKLRILVCGGRHFKEYEILKLLLNEYLFENHLLPSNIEIVSGNCDGADLLGERWAREKNIELKVFPAEWEKYGKSAGPIRNKQMIDYIKQFESKLVIAFASNNSIGTKNTIKLAKKENIPIIEVNYEITSNPVSLYQGLNYNWYDSLGKEDEEDGKIVNINCINVKIPLKDQVVDYYKYRVDNDAFPNFMGIEECFDKYGKSNSALVEIMERCCEDFYARSENKVFPLRYIVAEDRENYTPFSAFIQQVLDSYDETKGIEYVAPEDRNLIIIGDASDDSLSFQDIINTRLFFKNIAIFKIDKD